MNVHFVVGPTASGKSEFAVDLALRLNTEVVGADSVQIYREFQIGSAKITPEEMKGVRHHMIDFLDPRTPFTVMEYRKLAWEAIRDICDRTGTAVVCGGTGFYVHSLLYRFDEIPEADAALRTMLNAMNLEELTDYAAKRGIQLTHDDSMNQRRVIRAIEIFSLSGKEKGSYRNLERTEIDPVFHFLFPQRSLLYERIHLRTDRMMQKGLIEETRRLILTYGEDLPALKSIGYKQAQMYLSGLLSLEETAEEIKKATRHYAKRQMTWFRRYRNGI